ncbi:MAG: hypothetical protein ACRDQ7_06615 [Haloechinothrix sp.]
MRLADMFSPAPREVRIAGAIIALAGLGTTVYALILLVDALLGTATTEGGNSVYAMAVYFGLLGAGVLACGVALLLGKLWARSPAIVIALILGGVGWYAAGPSARPAIGVPLIILAAAVVVLLFREPARAWALDLEGADSDEDTRH